VQTSAIRKALSRLASTIGTSITSGGMGKTELSRKEMTPIAGTARGCAARRITQS
jgi:hypothetical protein